MYDQLLVPTDGSQTARLAARRALPVAEAFDTHVLSVVDTRQFSEQLAGVDQLVRERRDALADRAPRGGRRR